MESLKVLVLAHIWPEAAASAASTRLLDLLAAFKDAGYAVTVSADGRESKATTVLREQGYDCVRMPPNDASFDPWLATLEPQIVLFDRFTSEEKFSWRVRKVCPDALRILDTIDLHFLRLAREKAFHAGAMQDMGWPDIIRWSEDLAAREIAAIYRSDLSLIVSDYELELLVTHARVPHELLHLCRLTYSCSASVPGYAARSGFGMIGNFKHPPNADAVLYLRDVIWPFIRREIHDAEVQIWGAHASRQQLAWTAPALGFHVRGYAPDQFQALKEVRVNLAPLRYGAGIKGKIADGWTVGTPVVTMPVGAEGMHEDHAFGGSVCEDPEAFAAAACLLYRDPLRWQEASQRGMAIIDKLYSPSRTTQAFLARLEGLRLRREKLRVQNFIGLMLWQQGLRSSEYFSRWIEAKQQLRLALVPEKD